MQEVSSSPNAAAGRRRPRNDWGYSRCFGLLRRSLLGRIGRAAVRVSAARSGYRGAPGRGSVPGPGPCYGDSPGLKLLARIGCQFHLTPPGQGMIWYCTSRASGRSRKPEGVRPRRSASCTMAGRHPTGRTHFRHGPGRGPDVAQTSGPAAPNPKYALPGRLGVTNGYTLLPT